MNKLKRIIIMAFHRPSKLVIKPYSKALFIYLKIPEGSGIYHHFIYCQPCLSVFAIDLNLQRFNYLNMKHPKGPSVAFTAVK